MPKVKKALLILTILLVNGVVTPCFSARRGIQISEISLAHSGCFGSCPQYRVILRRDGTATYIGEFYVKRVGAFEGKIRKADFATLVNLIEAKRFFELKPRYDSPPGGQYVTDLDMVTVTVSRGGETTSVEDYGENGPSELRQIEDAIERITRRIKWKKR